jgi:hypothetical protein
MKVGRLYLSNSQAWMKMNSPEKMGKENVSDESEQSQLGCLR